jgi:hypothetical protein
MVSNDGRKSPNWSGGNTPGRLSAPGGASDGIPSLAPGSGAQSPLHELGWHWQSHAQRQHRRPASQRQAAAGSTRSRQIEIQTNTTRTALRNRFMPQAPRTGLRTTGTKQYVLQIAAAAQNGDRQAACDAWLNGLCRR